MQSIDPQQLFLLTYLGLPLCVLQERHRVRIRHCMSNYGGAKDFGQVGDVHFGVRALSHSVFKTKKRSFCLYLLLNAPGPRLFTHRQQQETIREHTSGNKLLPELSLHLNIPLQMNHEKSQGVPIGPRKFPNCLVHSSHTVVLI